MFKAFKYSILAGVALALVGCTKATVEVVPNIEKQSFNKNIIYAKFDSNKTYMKKYLPSNVVITDDAPISVEYYFANNAAQAGTEMDFAHQLFNPFAIFGASVGNKTLQLGASLRFFNQNERLVVTALCNSNQDRNVFSQGSLTKLRKLCIPEIQKNLEQQINLKFEKGEFNVFK